MNFASFVFCKCCTVRSLLSTSRIVYVTFPKIRQKSYGSVTMDTPLKSPNDKREYRTIVLKNGLTALLISDKGVVGNRISCDVNERSCASLDDNDGTDDSVDGSEEDDESGSGSEGDSGQEDDEDVSGEDEDGSEDVDEDDEDEIEKDSDSVPTSKDQKMAAAALCINVGSFSDPDDIPGLAHLLEHMVFMGCKKYPTENSFDAFIKRHGGSDNASTDCERTLFHFEVHKKYFREALDRFAQFFISPLLKKGSMDREIEAVDSEFQMSLPSDSFRKQQLFGSLATDGHPMKKFMWGNVATLKTQPSEKKCDVHERLLKFREKHYVAQHMTLAVQSQESLETLEQWVSGIFSEVPGDSLPRPSFSEMNEPFNTNAFRKIYKVVTVKNVHRLELNWALPSMVNNYREKPLEYLWFLIGHEGKGSILSYLKRKVWALSLWVDDTQSEFESNSCYSLFSVGIELTEDGFKHVFEVISAVFGYIEMLRQVGPQERIYQEIKTIFDNSFRWQEEMGAVDYVEDVCNKMQLYPPKDYLVGDELLFEYNEKLIRECQEHLRPENANIILFSKQFEKDGICDTLEPWFQTPYCVNDVDPEWITAWQHLNPDPSFSIPEVNRFIATDFVIKTPDKLPTEIPEKILDNEQSSLWYKKDNKFLVPKAFIYFHLISPVARSSPQSSVMMDLFVNVLGQNIKEDVYAADVANLAYNIYDDEMGLIIKVCGFNHKLPILFETIMNHIANFNVTDSLFDALKANLSNTYYNNFIKPSKLCRDVRLSILQQIHWTPIDKQGVVGNLTKDMLTAFVKAFKSHLFIEGLVQGNISADEALELDNIIRTTVKCGQVPWNMWPEVRVMELPVGNHFCRVASFNKEDGNSVVTNYYQSGPADIYKTCIMDILTDFMEEPCFDFLRTREQLGYKVSCQSRSTFGILGFSVTVHTQADKFSCQQIDSKIEEFLEKFKAQLNSMSEKEFKTQVSSLIKLKRCVDLHLKEEVDRNWGEILSHNYVFRRLEREIECLSKITLKEVQEWFLLHSSPGAQLKKLGVQVVGTSKIQDATVKVARKRRSSGRSCGHHSDKVLKGQQKGSSDEKLSKSTVSEIDSCCATDGSGTTADATPESQLVKLMFVNTPDCDSSTFIRDIRTFKQKLMIYPVNKILK